MNNETYLTTANNWMQDIVKAVIKDKTNSLTKKEVQDLNATYYARIKEWKANLEEGMIACINDNKKLLDNLAVAIESNNSTEVMDTSEDNTINVNFGSNAYNIGYEDGRRAGIDEGRVEMGLDMINIFNNCFNEMKDKEDSKILSAHINLAENLIKDYNTTKQSALNVFYKLGAEDLANALLEILYSDPKNKESADIIKRIIEDIFKSLNDSDEEEEQKEDDDE